MRLAASPRASSSTFVTWQSAGSPTLKEAAKEAARALAKYEAELATEAVASIEDDQKDPRPQALIRVEGHLFDKGVLNRLIDIAVDSPCDFEVCCCPCVASLHTTANPPSAARRWKICMLHRGMSSCPTQGCASGARAGRNWIR